MAKIPFSKLNIKNTTIIPTNAQFGEIDIEVLPRLTTDDRVKFMEEIIANVQSENAFINEISLTVWFDLCVLFYYTNLTFTDKQKSDPGKLYDMCITSGLLSIVKSKIGPDELDFMHSLVNMQIEKIYNYRNSAYGILDAMKNDYDNLNLDATEIQKKLGDEKNLAVLKETLTKLG